jgi:DNA-3-methyladenine glycosylase
VRRKVLRASFFARPTLEVLEDLIGKVLVHTVRGRRVSGEIVEAEAYIGESDPACHAAPGPTRRNAPLYGPPGLAYVYLNYGIHNLVNVVTEHDGFPAAILIRALEPREGIQTMRRRRGAQVPTARLCKGPGNLTVALGITLDHNRVDLAASPLTIEDHGLAKRPLGWSPRIGIRHGTDKPWRCFATDSDAVSGRPTS